MAGPPGKPSPMKTCQLVERFASGVIDGLAKHFIVAPLPHKHDLTVAA